jgi:hypothetical protein
VGTNFCGSGRICANDWGRLFISRQAACRQQTTKCRHKEKFHVSDYGAIGAHFGVAPPLEHFHYSSTHDVVITP